MSKGSDTHYGHQYTGMEWVKQSKTLYFQRKISLNLMYKCVHNLFQLHLKISDVMNYI